MDDRIKEEALIQNLSDAGLKAEEIEEFLLCWRQDKQAAQMRFLNEYRGKLLSTVRDKQEKLYCLDYLIRKLKNKN